MAVFVEDTADSVFEGQALLAAALYPTPALKAQAKIRGRRRLARVDCLTDPMVPPAPAAGDDKFAPLAVRIA